MKRALEIRGILNRLQFKKAAVYYAALSSEYKEGAVASFKRGDIEILVATLAFGLVYPLSSPFSPLSIS